MTIIKLKRLCMALLAAMTLISADSAVAEGWKMPQLFANSRQAGKKSDFSKTLKQVDAGTKKFIRGTIDVVTLKPLWDNDKPQRPVDPWMRHTRKQKEKKSFWASLFESEQQPKRAATVGEWVGLERPK